MHSRQWLHSPFGKVVSGHKIHVTFQRTGLWAISCFLFMEELCKQSILVDKMFPCSQFDFPKWLIYKCPTVLHSGTVTLRLKSWFTYLDISMGFSNGHVKLPWYRVRFMLSLTYAGFWQFPDWLPGRQKSFLPMAARGPLSQGLKLGVGREALAGKTCVPLLTYCPSFLIDCGDSYCPQVSWSSYCFTVYSHRNQINKN